MKLQLLFCYALIVFFSFNFFSQSIVLNEVSQGPSGNKEYVELLVIPGTSSYNCSNYCLDLRNWILDDNNGYFSGGPTSGVGIANGAVRFKNDPFWQCIPIGTLIVIYNDLDPNASLPANDISISDGNCRLIIPVSSTLLEHETTSPTTMTSTYPATGWNAGGLWGPISMANGGDSFQIYSPSNLTTPIHGVSWVNNTINSIIYFATSATNSVFYFAELDNQVIGYLKLNFGGAQTELKDNKALEIERIYVTKAFHGKKVGQLLYNKAIEVAKEKSADYIWLGVWEENQKALQFYKKNGFVEFDKHVFVLGDDAQTDLMMKLELTK